MIRRYVTLAALLIGPFIGTDRAPADGVQITPSSGTIDVPPYAQSQTQVFSVKNTGDRTVDFSIQAADCQPFELNCSWSTFSLNGVAPNQSVPLTVTFTSGAPGWSGTIAFVAKVNDNQSVSAGATITVRVPQQAWVETKSLNPGTTIERSHCVGFTVATNAASECGDLRIAHALASLRIRSDDRTPVLLYNSAHADPFPVVRANVSTPTGSAATNVTASLLVQRGANRVTVATQPIGTLAAGATQRVALGYSASGDATGVYPYTFKVTMTVNGATRTDSSFDSLVVVNRTDSPFGPGWWVAGVDQWIPVPNALLIVGGDGSTRLFTIVDANGYILAAPAFDRPDTIVTDTVGFTGAYRLLRHGARTNFLSNRHVATIDPLGFKTTFEYDANGRLRAILHPGAAQVRHRFYYSSNGSLDSITGPGPTSGTRKVVLVHAQRGKITRITDPDGKFVTFGYSGSTAVTIQSRTNRNGFTQSFTFASNRLVQADVPLTATTTATSAFCPAEIRGLSSGGCGGSGALAPDAAVSTIDGPRPATDVNDVTTVAIDRFGGPSTVTDAVGNSTRLYRGNRGLPGLVTRVVDKNFSTHDAYYDAKGLTAARVDYAPLGPGRDAVTTYQWDPKWDRVTQITFPELNVLRFAYDSLTGNRIWQEDGRGSTSRVNFRYYTSGGGDRLLRAAEYPTQISTGDRDSVEYDANGNAAHIRQVSGNLVWTARHFVNDATGRTTSACTDIDIAGNGGQQCQLRVYDVMDRDSVVTDSGPPSPTDPYIPAQAIRVKSFYDAEGNLTRVERSSFNAGVPNGIGTLTTQWLYDRADRRVKEIAGDGAADSLVYDPAGNTTRFLSRRKDPANPGTRLAIDMTYDALNRLTRRTLPAVTYPLRDEGIPKARFNGDTLSISPYPRLPRNLSQGLTIAADTETFAYDAMGAIRTADNRDALVSRSYYDNGLIRAETLKVRDYTGADFSKHVYPVGYEYDFNGRRSALTYPAQLTTTAGGTFNRVHYQYDAGSGALASVTDLQNNVFTFAYDAQTRLDSLVLPGRIVRKFGYDGASRLISDFILNRDSTTLGHFSTGRLRETTLGYNSRGDLLLAGNGVAKLDTLAPRYYGLGYLASSAYSDITQTQGGPVRHTSGESFARDGLGNDTSSFTAIANAVTKPFEIDVGQKNTTYQPGTGRQVRVNHVEPQPGGSLLLVRADSLLYDESGNVAFAWTIGQATGRQVIREDRAMFYAADGRLRVVDHRTATVGGPTGVDVPITLDFDEHRYDALGRRVLSRTQRECVITTPSLVCGVSTIRRTVWDGSQEIVETQQPGHTGTNDSALENDTAFAPRQPIFQPGVLNADLNPFYGRVAYTVGPSLDQPLSVTRWAYQADSSGQLAQWPEPFTIVPHWNTRGEADEGAFADGSIQHCESTIPSRCLRVAWPFGWTANQQKVFQVAAWHGTLLEQKRDGSGLLFKRNRYLDPTTGKFTQEDPIGLAGGMNLYGFAAGDPVNFSDPFGLDCRFPATGEKCDWDPIKAWRGLKRTLDVIFAVLDPIVEGGGCGDGYACGSGPQVGPRLGGGTINPATVRFSQGSIKAGFSAGGSVDELAAGLRSGAIDPKSVPAIRLVERNGVLYTLDNRRLAAFQKAGVDVPYRMATPQEIAAESWKFTTKNEGTSIRIRGQP